MNSKLLKISLQLSLGALLIPSGTVLAVRPKPQATPEPAKEEVVPKDGAPPPPYVLKNRSSFNKPGATARVPFWPVGWSKQKPNSPVVAAAPTAAPTIDEKSFKVSSILIGNGGTASYAVINGRSYGEGELIRMPKSSQPVRIRVDRINDGYVILDHDSQKLTVPLRRQELNQHKPEDELLDPNR